MNGLLILEEEFMESQKSDDVTRILNKIEIYKEKFLKANSYDDLNSIIQEAFVFLEEVEEQTGEIIFSKITYALNTINPLLTMSDYQGMNVQDIHGALNTHAPKNIEKNAILVETFKLFNSYFCNIDRVRQMERQRQENMNELWGKLAKKFEKTLISR